ncbi:MAG: SMC-Scp complex subunit ScpB [Bacilli bacterium]|nr:SMC-Scp complex subunit ScpB [Bacilli bacterium]
MNFEAILEGLLFLVGDEGLSEKQILEILEISKEELNELLQKLEEEYNNSNRGLSLVYLGDTYKLTTKKEYKKYYEKLISNQDSNLLSQAALETLAIIAYNEPITRVEVDELRGVSSIHIVRKLVAKGLIKEAGKSDLPGKPMLYKTTKEFLDYFGLSTINDLPKLEEIEVSDIDDVDLFKTNKAEIEELEILGD